MPPRLKAPKERLLLYYDPVFLEHETGPHPECPARLSGVIAGLESSPLRKAMELRRPRPATEGEILRVHEPALVKFIRARCGEGGGVLDEDNVLSPRSLEAALQAAGAAVQGVEAVWKGPQRRAFCAVRPPGHHARPGNLMGFCLLNSAAVAAKHARDAMGAGKLAVLDLDVHHGNGTQEIFYEDPSVLFVSLHRYPFWPPGSGSRDERGAGAGKGANLNFPLPHNTGPKNYLEALDQALSEVLAFRPDLLLVSMGFDTFREDPVAPGGLNLEVEHYPILGAKIRKVADEACGGRVVTLLEGGYHLGLLPLLVEGFLGGLTGLSDKA